MAPEIDLNNQVNRFGFRVWLDRKINTGEGYHKLRSQGEFGLEDTYIVDNEPLIVETDGKVEGRLSKAFVSDNHSKGIKESCIEVVSEEIESLGGVIFEADPALKPESYLKGYARTVGKMMDDRISQVTAEDMHIGSQEESNWAAPSLPWDEQME